MLMTNGFTGKMNLDTQAYRMPQGDWVYAINITRDASSDGQDVVVSNFDGNSPVTYPLPSGINKCIGRYEDKLRNRVYIYIWNSDDFDSILYYDRTTRQIVSLVQNIVDTYGDVLKFNPSFKINHTDIVYRDQIGDLLLWTDGLNSPREINVDTINNGTYTAIKENFIELAKRPPLITPTCVYGSDTTKNANNLRKALFQFTVRWYYDDYSKSTFSTFSKVPLQIGFYGSDNDIDNTNNNFITINFPTGDENVARVEIAVRISNGPIWNDFVTAVILDKSALNIQDNDIAQYLFYNDNTYPTIPIAEQIQLFDWVPQNALTQALPNGSTPVYAAITEGYNNIPQNLLDVRITVQNKTNVPPDEPGIPSLTFQQIGSATFVFTVGSVVPEGTRYRAYIFFNGTPPAQTFGVRLVGDYTSVFGDTAGDVAFALYSQFNSFSSVPTIGGSYLGGVTWQSNFNFAGAYPYSIQVNAGTPTDNSISTEKVWMWDSNYIFGIVYVDDQNRDMPGVTTFTLPTDSENDFAVTTPSFSEDTGQPQTPVIFAEINHLPPAGAVRYYWVRRRATYGDFIQYITCDFQEDADFYYMCLANIKAYHDANTQFIYADYVPTSESRIKVIVGEGSDIYANIFNQDYLILGTELRTLTGGSSPADDKIFIKVKKPLVAPSPVYQPNMLVQVYQPYLNPVTDAGAVFYEWGEDFDIYTGANGIKYHAGQLQSQNASQPATFEWQEGDVYFHQRTMYNDILTGGPFSDTVSIMDQNFSDFFLSGVNDNGRPQVIETNATQAFLPALVRFGQSYQSETTINEINRFYFSNFDEWDRGKGTVMKLFIEGRNMFVFHQLDIGVVPVLTQVVKDTQNNPLQANSDQLLNKIQYPYIGGYGIGNVPESFAYGKHAKYGIDNLKGVAWRLSQDGITPLSIVFECNNFFVTQTEPYNNSLNNGYNPDVYSGNPTIYGVYNEFKNRVVWAFEEINRYTNPATLLYEIQSLFLNELLYLGGTPDTDLDITLNISAANGNFQSVSYSTSNGASISDIRFNLRTQINAGVLFTATNVSPIQFTGLGLEISNVALSNVSLELIIVGNLKYHKDPQTIVFNEGKQADRGFETFLEAYPEMMGCLNNLLLMWKDGYLWVFEDAPHCNFFGEQKGVSITPLLNTNQPEKKTYISIAQFANKAWPCPEIVTQLNSYGNTQQLSKLVAANFERLENDWHSSFMRDMNSQGGWINGWSLKGAWIQIKLEVNPAPDFTFLNGVTVKYIDSPLTNK